MIESAIQAKIIKYLKKEWWFTIKTIKVSPNGIPDLICFRWGKHLFIEVKQENGKLSPLQDYVIKQLRENGDEVIIPYWFKDFIIKYEELWKALSN